ncbi:phosphate ABC transporter permease PstA [Formicincola oecophyllae]|uniref:Phosphate transport system permease protein PstA n=1 Tax=Formicincola oecophyllae TaxID=2558361 RepID=A0A4Y6UAI2_9PROT|nr:phosphate ABC transporter permease PstA [Formicincola oecophyllae]QDH13466.1 phosphate ABC transporter permease PstA [Formicincola oecophyllae]
MTASAPQSAPPPAGTEAALVRQELLTPSDRWQPGGRAAWRRFKNRLATFLATMAAVVLVLVLASILWTLFIKGLPGLSVAVFLRPMAPPGVVGGLGNAILGSVIQTALAMAIATPIGLGCGVYLAEYALPHRPFTKVARFAADLLMSVPSILAGLFVYQLCVVPFGHFSGWAGALALAVLAIPLVVRTTEDMLGLVPKAMMEAGAALGAPRWIVITRLCMRAAREGIATGLLLALARTGGETAPLLFTALGNQDWSLDPSRPMASLPLAIYQYAGAAYADWVGLAWTGALLVTLAVLGINIATRAFMRKS